MTSKAEILHQLRLRLEAVEGLDAEMRDALRRGDVGGIESRTSRLQTLALEFKTLQQEFVRLPVGEDDDDPALDRARGELETVVVRIVRAAAIGGGLLQQVAALSRRLLEAVGGEIQAPYERSGRRAPLEGQGLKLRETV